MDSFLAATSPEMFANFSSSFQMEAVRQGQAWASSLHLLGAQKMPLRAHLMLIKLWCLSLELLVFLIFFNGSFFFF